ncbi:hypothetical protein ACFSE1_09405 [Rhizobium helianthi]|uniref:Uncharacterized protein n=1 Tax=Rhizobium helianthi TaxID=1132695 RepID=A0ABW4M3D0_9HYPH
MRGSMFLLPWPLNWLALKETLERYCEAPLALAIPLEPCGVPWFMPPGETFPVPVAPLAALLLAALAPPEALALAAALAPPAEALLLAALAPPAALLLLAALAPPDALALLDALPPRDELLLLAELAPPWLAALNKSRLLVRALSLPVRISRSSK